MYAVHDEHVHQASKRASEQASKKWVSRRVGEGMRATTDLVLELHLLDRHGLLRLLLRNGGAKLGLERGLELRLLENHRRLHLRLELELLRAYLRLQLHLNEW